jgi:hypothetical protein
MVPRSWSVRSGSIRQALTTKDTKVHEGKLPQPKALGEFCALRGLWFYPSVLKLTRGNNFGQHIRLGFVAHQMRILFAAVIVELVGDEIICVLDQQLERVGGIFSCL